MNQLIFPKSTSELRRILRGREARMCVQNTDGFYPRVSHSDAIDLFEGICQSNRMGDHFEAHVRPGAVFVEYNPDAYEEWDDDTPI